MGENISEIVKIHSNLHSKLENYKTSACRSKISSLLFLLQGYHINRHGRLAFDNQIEAEVFALSGEIEIIITNLYHDSTWLECFWYEFRVDSLLDYSIEYIAKTFGQYSRENLEKIIHHLPFFQTAINEALESTCISVEGAKRAIISHQQMIDYFTRNFIDIEVLNHGQKTQQQKQKS